MWYFTADQHFGHAKSIEYELRPFESADEMDEKIIENYNSVITDKDDVVFCGDIFFHKPDKAIEIMERLKGRKYWILGNHDKNKIINAISHFFKWVKHYYELKIDGQKIVICHYPLLTWNRGHYGSFMIHAHSHSNLAGLKMSKNDQTWDIYENRIIDVGVDAQNFYPISYVKIKEILYERNYYPVDHHVGKGYGETIKFKSSVRLKLTPKEELRKIENEI